MKILYWVLFLIIFYVYFGYPFLLFCIRRIVGRKNIQKAEYYPCVSLIIAAYNEEKTIRKRLENILTLTYPKDKLEVLIVSDACTDNTDIIVKEFEGQEIKFYRQEQRQGKMAALNTIVPMAKGEILVFSDADAIFKENNIEMLVRNFNDPKVGCVAGKKIPVTDEKTYAASEGLYWKYESSIKELESELGNLVSGTCGPNLALRRCLYEPLDEKTIAEDLLLPLICISKGYRTVFEAEAICYEFLLPSSRDEFKRKIRIVTGGLHAILVGRNSLKSIDLFTLFQLVSHKFMRWLASIGLVVFLVLNFFVKGPVYEDLLILQIVFYSFAAIGLILENKRYKGKLKKIFSVPYYFTSMNLAAILGILKLCFNMHGGWIAYEKVRVSHHAGV